MSYQKIIAIGVCVACAIACTSLEAQAGKSDTADQPAKSAVAGSTVDGARTKASPDDDDDDDDLQQVKDVIARADKLAASGKLDESVNLLIDALKDYGQNPHLRERLSRVYYMRGSVDEAIAELNAAISLDPTVFDYYASAAWLYSISGNYVESVKYAKTAVGLDDTKAYPFVVLGFSLGCLGKRQQAQEFLQRAIEIEPHNATAYLYLADVLSADGNYAKALPLYQKSLKLDGKNGSAFVGLGDCFQKLGHRDESLAAYKRAVELAPQDPSARGKLGFALSQSGDYMGAMRQGMTANSIRMANYWGKFMGMFVAVWAGIFILFGTIFSAMFMGSRFNPVAGEKVINQFMMVFYRDRPGRFVITDKRIVFVPEFLSRWFGATRVSIQRDQVSEVRAESRAGAGLLTIKSTSDTEHVFRIPAMVLEPVVNTLNEQGIADDLEATGAMKRIESAPAVETARECGEEEASADTQEQTGSIIAARYDFRDPDNVDTDTVKLEALKPEDLHAPASEDQTASTKTFTFNDARKKRAHDTAPRPDASAGEKPVIETDTESSGDENSVHKNKDG